MSALLGLDELESLVYRFLVSQAHSTVDDVVAELRHPASEVAAVVDRLVQRTVVVRHADGATVSAAPPAQALGAVVADRQSELRAAQAELDTLGELYRTASSGRSLAGLVDVLPGQQAVHARMLQAMESLEDEWLTTVRPGATLHTPQGEGAAMRARERGVRHRILAERQFIEHSPLLSSVVESDAARPGATLVRIRAGLPAAMLVFDRRAAIIPVRPAGGRPDTGALVVHEGPLLSSLVALFDLLWSDADRVVPSDIDAGAAGTPDLDPLDRRILSLVHAGMTDRAAGAELGLSMRTVQRRMRDLMDLSGTETRLQLGAAAVRRGWL
ncbi:helix-turn-helix domain-containing protein [Solicola sp. PLA-1-18]|uniref:helix-turn-helix domain-containing protein n=1 Tax=Solicola sp. PLA-1-18 TaxID=3380532 RepID=UPI003B7F184E